MSDNTPAAPNAHRSLDNVTTMPSTNAPSPCDTSKNKVNVAIA
jgi:hypothetical protein